MVKNLPAMQETHVQSLGREDPLEKGIATHSSCLENPMDRGSWRDTVHGVTKSQTQLQRISPQEHAFSEATKRKEIQNRITTSS